MCFLRTFDPRVAFFYPLPLCVDRQWQQSLLSNSQLIEPFLPLTQRTTDWSRRCNMFVDFGCCISRMFLTSTKFMYSNPLSVKEFLFANRILYVFGFIRDVFYKLNFNALSPVCNLFGETKKTKSLLAFWHHYSFTWRKMFRNAHTLQKPIEKHL